MREAMTPGKAVVVAYDPAVSIQHPLNSDALTEIGNFVENDWRKKHGFYESAMALYNLCIRLGSASLPSASPSPSAGMVERTRELAEEILDEKRYLNSLGATEAEKTLARAYIALLSQSSAGGWRDIASAPKDGTKVLLGRFTTVLPAERNGHIDVDWYRLPTDNRGYVGWGHFNPGSWPATHWQPLPPPPTPEAT